MKSTVCVINVLYRQYIYSPPPPGPSQTVRLIDPTRRNSRQILSNDNPRGSWRQSDSTQVRRFLGALRQAGGMLGQGRAQTDTHSRLISRLLSSPQAGPRTTPLHSLYAAHPRELSDIFTPYGYVEPRTFAIGKWCLSERTARCAVSFADFPPQKVRKFTANHFLLSHCVSVGGKIRIITNKTHTSILP
jgi:hypothetical protein